MEQNAKRSKLDDGVVFVLNKLKGRIVLRIEEISKFFKATRGCNSEPVRIRGFDLILFARAFSGPDNNGLEFYIKCDGCSRGPNMNCVASVTLLCTSGSKEVEMRRENDAKFVATLTNVTWISTVSI